MKGQKHDGSDSNCKHIPRPHVSSIIIDETTLNSILKDYRVLPIFEEKIYRYKQCKNSSLETNKLLRCRWIEYVKRKGPKTPFQFPKISDFHFHKGAVRYDPKESIINRSSYHFRLRAGPGVDDCGQIPIPDDLHLRKKI